MKKESYNMEKQYGRIRRIPKKKKRKEQDDIQDGRNMLPDYQVKKIF